MTKLVLWVLLLTPKPDCVKADEDANTAAVTIPGQDGAYRLRKAGAPPPPIEGFRVVAAKHGEPPTFPKEDLVCYSVAAAVLRGWPATVTAEGKLVEDAPLPAMPDVVPASK